MAGCTGLLGDVEVSPGGATDAGAVPKDSAAPADDAATDGAKVDAGPPLDGGSIDANAVDAADANPPPPPLGNAKLIAAGAGHTCAILTDQTVACWGRNERGQLGVETNGVPRLAPVLIPKVRGAIDIAPGESHTCAALTDGTVACWGDNSSGQLGPNAPVGAQMSVDPVLVPVANAVFTRVSSGQGFTCGIAGGQVYCWGANDLGQCGTAGSKILGPTLVPIGAGTAFTTKDIASGARHVCANVFTGGNPLQQAYCWGDNAVGQLGVTGGGTKPPGTYPALAMGQADHSTGSGAAHSCGVAQSNALFCWGQSDKGQGGAGANDGVQSRNLGNSIKTLSARGNNTCVIDSTDNVQCFGANGEGQLGIGSVDPNPHPALSPVPLGSRAAMIAVGGAHACAILQSPPGHVKCWGSNKEGQIGHGSPPDVSFPAPVDVIAPQP
jgi:alpha-tubulin suppressor-like RCC1 family protein